MISDRSITPPTAAPSSHPPLPTSPFSINVLYLDAFALRRRLAIAEAPRQQKCRLHRNPVSTIESLVNKHEQLLTVLEFQALKY
ncbi:MAG: hypothetical protein RMX98_035085 [Nostoc sp. DedQUE02]|nr:hypothetical protein [Nostoc sp. DedQUE02]